MGLLRLLLGIPAARPPAERKPLTWTCHVCGKERPDEKISVYSRRVYPRGIEFQENVRYCNDDPACVAGAPTIHWFPQGGTP